MLESANSVNEVPVITLTAAVKLEITEHLDKCDFDGFVAKTFDVSELQEIIEEVIFEGNQSAWAFSKYSCTKSMSG